MDHFAHYLSSAKSKGFDVSMEYLEARQLLALQGPGARSALAQLSSLDFNTMPFMFTQTATVAGIFIILLYISYILML